MKKLVVTMFAALALSFSVAAQEVNKDDLKKMSRKERKEYKLQLAMKSQAEVMSLLESKEWVLEANQLQDRYGETYFIESSINFIGVQNDRATVQLGDSGEVGLNGVGGITVEGSVRKYEIKENKKPGTGVYVRIEVSGASSGHVSMAIQISPDGTASATLTNTYGDRLTYGGRIVTFDESTVFKGFTLI